MLRRCLAQVIVFHTVRRKTPGCFYLDGILICVLPFDSGETKQ